MDKIKIFCREVLQLNPEGGITQDVMFRIIAEAIEKWENWKCAHENEQREPRCQCGVCCRPECLDPNDYSWGLRTRRSDIS